MEQRTEKQVSEILPTTLAMLEPTKQKPIMPLSWPDERQRRWLDKWLSLRPVSPHIRSLEFVVWNFCRDYGKRPWLGRRLLIHGPNGTGKTHTAKAIWNWALRTAMHLPLTSTQNHDDEYQLATSQYLFWPGVVDGFKRGEWSVIDYALEQSMLVLDDVGAEHDPSGIGREKLYYILERRSKKWMVMTTNCPPDEWETKFERRIASRFLRNCDIVDLSTLADFCSIQ